MRHVEEERLVLLAPALRATHRERRERRAVVARPARDEGAPLGIAALNVDLARERGVLVNRTDEKVIRLLPALNVTVADLDPAMDILDAVFATVGAGVPA